MLHFPRTEYTARLKAARAALRQAKLDGILLFAPESHYYLTGYDTFGYALFQAMLLPAAENTQPHLLTRAPDLRQAQQTSILSDPQIHIWQDHQNADPHAQLAQLIIAQNLKGAKLGIETNTAGLTAYHGEKLHAAITQTGIAQLTDATPLIPTLRLCKSPAELKYIHRAAELADDALTAALNQTRPGAFEGDILAAMHNAIFTGGGDYPGNEFIIGSDKTALLCRYHSGRRHLSPRDQLTLEWAGVYRHYHVAMMRTLIIGKANPQQKKMHAAATEALLACQAACLPGNPMGEIFTAHAQALDAHGFSHARLNACGYSLGAKYTPTWMDHPMFYRDNPQIIQPNMTLFLHMILMDSATNLAMCYGHTIQTTKTTATPLSRHPLNLLQC